MTVSLVFHINLGATCLPINRTDEYLNFLQDLTNEVKVPVCYSAVSEDWLWMHEFNPDLVSDIKENRLVDIIDSSYSHFLASMGRRFPGKQVAYGSFFSRHLFKTNSRVFMFPEYDLTHRGIVDLASLGYRSTIADNSVLEYYNGNKRVGTDSPVFYYDLDDDSFPVLNFVNRTRELTFTDLMYKYFREENSVEEVADYLKRLEKSLGLVVLCLDMETPMLSEVRSDGKRIKRLDCGDYFLIKCMIQE
jgi:hypothetical protein